MNHQFNRLGPAADIGPILAQIASGWRQSVGAMRPGADGAAFAPGVLEPIREGLERRLGSEAIHLRIYQDLRRSALSGRIAPNARLPSSRALANYLGVSRNTVVAAYDMLSAEGILETRRGSGTYVLPHQKQAGWGIGECGDACARLPAADAPIHRDERQTFRPNFPPLDQFPTRLWAQILREVLTELADDPRRYWLEECDPVGHLGLRRCLAEHFRVAHNLTCDPDDILIFAGPQQARDTILRALAEPGMQVLTELPGSPRLLDTLAHWGAQVVGVNTDGEGADFAEALTRGPAARLACLSIYKPSIFGQRLSAGRRQAIIDWAHDSDAWLCEDDCLDHLRPSLPETGDEAQRVREKTVYLGSFAKLLFPALRCGFAIVPERLRARILAARQQSGGYAPLLEQIALERFIMGGHLDRHIRRMNKLSIERREILVAEVERQLSGRLELQAAGSSTAMLGWLAPRFDSATVVRLASEHGLRPRAIETSLAEHAGRSCLLIGFTEFSPSELRFGVRRLARVLDRIDQATGHVAYLG